MAAELFPCRGEQRVRNRPGHPNSYHMWAKQLRKTNKNIQRDYFRLLWTTWVLDDYDLAITKTKHNPEWVTHHYCLQWVTSLCKQKISEPTERFHCIPTSSDMLIKTSWITLHTRHIKRLVPWQVEKLRGRPVDNKPTVSKEGIWQILKKSRKESVRKIWC